MDLFYLTSGRLIWSLVKKIHALRGGCRYSHRVQFISTERTRILDTKCVHSVRLLGVEEIFFINIAVAGGYVWV